MGPRTLSLPMFRRRGFALVPADADARRILSGMEQNECGVFEHRKPRNAKQHRKYFAILNNVVQASGEWPSTESLRFDIFRELKRGTEYVSPVDGTVHFFPDSMAVASMSRADFERLYEDTMRWLTDRYGCDPEMLTMEAA